MSEKVGNKQLSRHKKWMQETCPQTYNALYAETDGDSEDLKSCCLRLEQEVHLLESQLAEARELLNKIDIQSRNDKHCDYNLRIINQLSRTLKEKGDE